MNIDKELAKSDKNTIVLNGDMMKCIGIPIMKTKNSQFCDKLMLYNQTFCQLGEDNKAFCIISYEAEIRKSSNEFINFLLHFIKSKFCENYKNLIVWFDNSCSQNKNFI
jgi:hypothetical protein